MENGEFFKKRKWRILKGWVLEMYYFIMLMKSQREWAIFVWWIFIIVICLLGGIIRYYRKQTPRLPHLFCHIPSRTTGHVWLLLPISRHSCLRGVAQFSWVACFGYQCGREDHQSSHPVLRGFLSLPGHISEPPLQLFLQIRKRKGKPGFRLMSA